MTDAVRGLSSEKYKEKARRIGAEIDDYEMRSNALNQKEWVVLYQGCQLTLSSKKRLPNPNAGARCPQPFSVSLLNLLAIFNQTNTLDCAHSLMQMHEQR